MSNVTNEQMLEMLSAIRAIRDVTADLVRDIAILKGDLYLVKYAHLINQSKDLDNTEVGDA